MTVRAVPYRINVRTPEEPLVPYLPSRAPAASRASFFPLGIMAIAFFLPATVDQTGCNTPPVSATPMDLASRHVSSFVLLVPAYAAAALLALGILYAWTVNRNATLMGASALALCFVSAIYFGVGLTFATDDAKTVGIATLVCVTLVAAAGLVIAAARRRRGIQRLSLFIDVYTAMASPLALLNYVWARHYGAFVFLGSYGVLVAVRVTYGIHRLRRSRAAEPARCKRLGAVRPTRS